MNRPLSVRAFISAVHDAWDRWQKRRHDKYWGLGSYTTVDVPGVLAAAGAEARTGCVCEGCERLRVEMAEVLFRLNGDDIAYLAQYGIAWEAVCDDRP